MGDGRGLLGDFGQFPRLSSAEDADRSNPHGRPVPEGASTEHLLAGSMPRNALREPVDRLQGTRSISPLGVEVRHKALRHVLPVKSTTLREGLCDADHHLRIIGVGSEPEAAVQEPGHFAVRGVDHLRVVPLHRHTESVAGESAQQGTDRLGLQLFVCHALSRRPGGHRRSSLLQ